MIVFEAWEDSGSVTFTTQDNIEDHKRKGLLSAKAKLLYQLDANDYDEAMTMHHKKMGWEPYKPTQKK